MKHIHILTDTGADFTPAEAEALGITLLPLTVMFGDTCYRDAFELTHEDFYRKLIESDTLPTTSQVSPAVYEEHFAAIAAADEEAVCITISGELSGCYQSANIGAADYADSVHIVDSRSVCIGQRILVELAVQCRDQGMSASEIAALLDTEKSKIRVIALLDTLEYLKKGGRISAAAALAGSMLSIKPVVTVEDGVVKMLGKARGSKNANNLLKSLILRDPIDLSRPRHLAYSGLSTALLEKYIEDSRELYECDPSELPISSIGSAIGTHVGPGAIASAFFTGDVSLGDVSSVLRDA